MKNILRYKKLGYVGINVTNLEKSKRFYGELVGTEPVESNLSNIAFFRTSHDHHNIILFQAPRPGIKRIGLELESADLLEPAFEHFQAHGLNPYYVSEEECAMFHQGRSFRFQDPFGVTFEIYTQMAHMPFDFKRTHTKIIRLGHVVLKSNSIPEATKFYNEVMNFAISDLMEGDAGAWMRLFPVSYHHSFAIFKAEENGLHHVNFMVTDIDDIGRARNRFLRNDVPVVFGPGRHTPSGAVFLYFLDPDGMTMEYSFGMEEFPEENPRPPRLLAASADTIDLWGGIADPRLAAMGSVGEA
jgi:2,3-dihydroxy-p-cumate/2,3-dihydroxybenzoate 3,4-dioxygenase